MRIDKGQCKKKNAGRTTPIQSGGAGSNDSIRGTNQPVTATYPGVVDAHFLFGQGVHHLNAGRTGDDDRHAVLFVFLTRAIVVHFGVGPDKRNAE